MKISFSTDELSLIRNALDDYECLSDEGKGTRSALIGMFEDAIEAERLKEKYDNIVDYLEKR